MLPKNRRIKRKEFKEILKGFRYNFPHFLVYVSKIDGKKSTIFSFSVSKKVANKAILRNKMRRQGYAVISSLLKEIKPGFMCFFSYKKGKYPILYSELEKEITKILENVKLI